jgi:ABC-type branched-subunit amino acid transport system substrate-binding protein
MALLISIRLKCYVASVFAVLGTHAWAATAGIIIGQSAPLTGANAELGNDIRNGALAYFKKINDAGGINGSAIELITLDDKNEAKQSGENARELIQKKGAVALFGFASSTLSVPAMPAVAAAKVPFFAPFTGADAIRKQNEFVYTIRATYAEEIETLIGFWAPLGVTQVAVLHYDDDIGRQNFATAATVLAKFRKQPTSIAIKRNADLKPESINAIIAANPQIVLATTLYAPVAQMVKQLKTMKRPYSVTSLSFAGASQIAKALGPDAAGITVALTVPAPNQLQVPVVQECADAWRAAGQSESMSVTALEACIAAKVLVEGMKRAGREVTRESLHKALSALGRVDVGGVMIAFKPGFRHGGTYVDIAVIRLNGELRG